MKLLVAGLLPTGGTISVDDVPLSRCEKKLKEKLGYLPQDFGLYDELTVREFLDYMAALKGIRDSKAAIESAILATGWRKRGRRVSKPCQEDSAREWELHRRCWASRSFLF